MLVGISSVWSHISKANDPTAIRVEEAVSIAYRQAQTWRPTARLQFITSQDTARDYHDPSIPGKDGRRRAWGLQFKDPTTHEAIIIEILDGKVHEITEMGTDETPGIDPSSLHISGRSMVTTAIQGGLLAYYKTTSGTKTNQPVTAYLGITPPAGTDLSKPWSCRSQLPNNKNCYGAGGYLLEIGDIAVHMINGQWNNPIANFGSKVVEGNPPQEHLPQEA